MKKPSRNDACWCGSNQKYKKCHMASDEILMAKLYEFKKQGHPIPGFDLIKTNAEIEGIRKSGDISNKILDELNTFIKAGITTDEINDLVHNLTLDYGAIPAPLNYRGYPKSTCTSINNVICHGIPDNTLLKDGAILNVDVTCILDGFYGDTNRMYMIGTPSKEAQTLVAVTKQCLEMAIQAVKPYKSINVIGDAIEPYVKKFGFSVVKDYGGHGTGTDFHQDPFIFHYQRTNKDMIMVPNMVFTIEPMINAGSHHTKLLSDKWTSVTTDNRLSAQWEHTLRVTETGAEILA